MKRAAVLDSPQQEKGNSMNVVSEHSSKTDFSESLELIRLDDDL